MKNNNFLTAIYPASEVMRGMEFAKTDSALGPSKTPPARHNEVPYIRGMKTPRGNRRRQKPRAEETGQSVQRKGWRRRGGAHSRTQRGESDEV
ncbi:hypothetical protein E2C01_052755 [Portunus trituberculatus]|uniref:Uncharacterized protein n=1 Tax=Portunus trituberculatus TaxID=210409 RepID=A0A5B7GMP0_PORTR|nr:hypothetical protein [Portunus trituberculatus]